MDFFNSLTLDVKMLVIGIIGCTLLAFFSGSRGAEKRYLVVLAVLVAAGVYRFERTTQVEKREVASSSQHFITVTTKHTPLVSTSAK